MPPQVHAVAALSAGPPPVARAHAATACRHQLSKDYVFEQGRILLERGAKWLDGVTAKHLVDGFRELHPKAPRTIGAYLNMREFRQSVRASDKDLFTLQRSVPAVKILPTIQAKLVERQDLKPLVDWGMEWIRATRESGGVLSLDAMQAAWVIARTNDLAYPLFADNPLLCPKHAAAQCGIQWKTWIAHEQFLDTGGEAADVAGPSENDAGDTHDALANATVDSNRI